VGTIPCVLSSRFDSEGRLEHRVRWKEPRKDELLLWYDVDAEEELKEFHRSYVQKPRFGARSKISASAKEKLADCSFLVTLVYRTNGV